MVVKRKKKRTPAMGKRGHRRSLAELKLEALLVGAGIPKPVREHRCVPGRLFRFDLAWPVDDAGGVAVELHGATFTHGRHVTGRGFGKDREKMNAAQLNGWTVLEFTTDDLRRRPDAIVTETRSALKLRGCL